MPKYVIEERRWMKLLQCEISLKLNFYFVAILTIYLSCVGFFPALQKSTYCAGLGNQSCDVVLVKGALTWENYKGSGLE
jgi:hypothetical protein